MFCSASTAPLWKSLRTYQGDPRGDHILNALVARHQSGGCPHRGNLLRIPAKAWEAHKNEITLEIRHAASGGTTGFEPEFYDVRNTLQEDALDCFRAHHRNPDCPDYKSAAKRLTPGTETLRKQAGLPKYRSPRDRYLCEFCPVHSLVQQKAHDDAARRG